MYEGLPRAKDRAAAFEDSPPFKIKKTAEGFYIQTLRSIRDSDYNPESRRIVDEVLAEFFRITEAVYMRNHDISQVQQDLTNLEARLHKIIDEVLSLPKADLMFVPSYRTPPGNPFPNLSSAMTHFNESLREDGFNEVWMDKNGKVVKEFGCSPS